MLEEQLAKAACKGKDTSVFFPEGGRPNFTTAKQICSRCEVINECREYAIDNFFEAGIWGGLTIREIRQQRRVKFGTDVTAPKRTWVIR